MSHIRRFLLITSLAGCAGSSPEAGDSWVSDDDEPLRIRSHEIALASGSIDTSGPSEDLREAAGARVLVKLPGPPTEGQLEALEEASERIYAYLPDDAFLVKPRGDLDGLGAAWIGRYRPEHKLAPAVRAAAADRRRDKVVVMVQVFPDADLERALADLRVAGVPAETIVGRGAAPSFSRVRLVVTPEELERLAPVLAAHPDVFWVGVEGRRVLLNDTTVWVGQSGLDGGQTKPVFDHGIYGEGQIVAVLDSGLDADMCYFHDAARGLPPMNVCDLGTRVDLAQRKVIAVDFLWDEECAGGISTDHEWDGHGHGTHVAGTIAGDSAATPLEHDAGDGMAPGAKLVIQDCGGPEIDDCADCSGIGCPVVDLNPFFQQAYDQGARIHNNSWGDRENFWPQNTYTAACQDVDEFMWANKDFLLVFAAGNSGPGQGSVGSPSTAKSALSVGATRRGTSADAMAGFSSCGPTDDGRQKPEITMPGASIVSADYDGDVASMNCTRGGMSGTSMAAPGAAGLAALVRQYFADGFYPTGAAVAANGFNPSAALVRAALVSSGREMTGAGVIPGMCQGWGRATLDDVLHLAGDARGLWVREDEGFAGAGVAKSFKLIVAAGQPLKVTLAWTDFPSTPAAARHVVNDLDLEVQGPAGTFLGNVFAQGSSAAGGAADRRNTLEQVLLRAPQAGEYTVTVRAFTVPRGPQPFSLVVTGDVAAVNGGPEANAGADQSASTAAVVTLDGRGSTHGAGLALRYAWKQVAGPAMTITGVKQPVARVVPLAAGSYTFELTVSDGSASDTDTVTVTVAGPDAQVVFEDDFEADRGWTRNAGGSDTATRGTWERGNPSSTTQQLGQTVSGLHDLVTGRFAGSSPGAHDLDGGKSTIQSPPIAIPSSGTVTLAFSYYLSHAANSSTVDSLRVRVVGATTQTVLQVKGAEAIVAPAWTRAAVELAGFAGQTVRVVVEATDAGRASLVEAAVDDVVVVRKER
jgi:subtilisin family serine protease